MCRYRTVIFDCDSTLCAIEGIDELAEGDVRAEIEELTDAAMRGAVPLEEVYGRRLALIAPTRDRIDQLGRQYVEALLPDAVEVVAALRSAGVRVRIISGGLRPAVERAARELGVPAADVAAVDIFFAEDGRYAGFEESSPLARSMGKFDVISAWRRELPVPMMLVGDGMTDLEAKEAVDSFVAFAGIVQRDDVIAAADEVIRERSLAPVLELACPQVQAASDLRRR